MISIVMLKKTLFQERCSLPKGKGGWREVGRNHGVTGAMAYRIANSDYEPKDPRARKSLGLVTMETITTGPGCYVAPGALVRQGSRRCVNSPCPVEFVPVVPNQLCCSPECSKARRKTRIR